VHPVRELLVVKGPPDPGSQGMNAKPTSSGIELIHRWWDATLWKRQLPGETDIRM